MDEVQNICKGPTLILQVNLDEKKSSHFKSNPELLTIFCYEITELYSSVYWKTWQNDSVKMLLYLEII